MKIAATILIADRNPRVRRYIQREMINAGYHIIMAENSRQVLFWIRPNAALDLLIVDPDLPGLDAGALFAELRKRSPQMPIVIHSLRNESMDSIMDERVWFVEKRGNSIDVLKKTVVEIINKKLLVGAHP